MNRYYLIGAAPPGEKYLAGKESSGDAFRRCQQLIRMLRTKVAFEPAGCQLIIAQASRHTPTLVVKVSAKTLVGENYANNLRDRCPCKWDAEARRVLGIASPKKTAGKRASSSSTRSTSRGGKRATKKVKSSRATASKGGAS